MHVQKPHAFVESDVQTLHMEGLDAAVVLVDIKEMDKAVL